jgi:hypothetical protein
MIDESVCVDGPPMNNAMNADRRALREVKIKRVVDFVGSFDRDGLPPTGYRRR